jgi:chaperonin cofactor prefoldin
MRVRMNQIHQRQQALRRLINKKKASEQGLTEIEEAMSVLLIDVCEELLAVVRDVDHEISRATHRRY